MARTKPHFVIKNNTQKRGYLYSVILTPDILQDVCKLTTGETDYTSEFDNRGYNKGRLAKICYNNKISYISFSQHGKTKGRNSFFQSVPTALTQYYLDDKREKFHFYFLPFDGEIETNYHIFMYRLLITSNVNFLNPQKLSQTIRPFNTVNDMIASKNILSKNNRNNNSTHITLDSEKKPEVYGKTYGANKKETFLICLALSHLAPHLKLYQISEHQLKILPKPERDVLKLLNNIDVITTDITLDKKYIDHHASLRSPRFTYNLFEKIGTKKCAFCKCEIPELINGAHIWPVSAIKKISKMPIKDKIHHATNGDNGIWLCENHHKMFDCHTLKITKSGKLKYVSGLDQKSIDFIRYSTPVTKIKNEIIAENFMRYLTKRNKRSPKMDYSSL